MKYIINQIMEKISKPISDNYQKAFDSAMKQSAAQLYDSMKHAKMAIISYPSPYPQMNLLPTCGCSHKIKNGSISGCSMCNDNMSNMAKEYAMVHALRKKDVDLYAKFIRQSFINERGIVTEQMGNEVVTGCDSLEEIEFPEEVYRELFGSNGVYQCRPFRYSFEVRADSITKEKLEMMKRYLGKGRAFIEIGVEVSNEWVRNHWINKNITDSQIENAIKLIHAAGYKVNTNVLIGVPGLTEEQSIQLFMDSVKQLTELDSDRITFHPLTRKPYTLGQCIYEHLSEDSALKQIGIASGEHTGLPWMFTMIEAMARVFEAYPNLSKKFGVGQFNIFEGSDILAYNARRDCSCNKQLYMSIDRALKTLQIAELVELRESMKKDSCYKSYEELLERQRHAGDLYDTIKTVGNGIINKLWIDERAIQTEQFLVELEGLKDLERV